jgi:hypothetical protein
VFESAQRVRRALVQTLGDDVDGYAATPGGGQRRVNLAVTYTAADLPDALARAGGLASAMLRTLQDDGVPVSRNTAAVAVRSVRATGNILGIISSAAATNASSAPA